MRMTQHTAESIRVGIADAKLDLAEGHDCHDHEPALPGVGDFTWGIGPAYDRVAEDAYWHTFEKQGQVPSG